MCSKLKKALIYFIPVPQNQQTKFPVKRDIKLSWFIYLHSSTPTSSRHIGSGTRFSEGFTSECWVWTFSQGKVSCLSHLQALALILAVGFLVCFRQGTCRVSFSLVSGFSTIWKFGPRSWQSFKPSAHHFIGKKNPNETGQLCQLLFRHRHHRALPCYNMKTPILREIEQRIQVTLL